MEALQQPCAHLAERRQLLPAGAQGAGTRKPVALTLGARVAPHRLREQRGGARGGAESGGEPTEKQRKQEVERASKRRRKEASKEGRRKGRRKEERKEGREEKGKEGRKGYIQGFSLNTLNKNLNLIRVQREPSPQRRPYPETR